MTTAESTTTKSGSAHQKPTVLCQLKSRARPASPRRNHVTLLNAFHERERGHQR
jgi:hypothetical protein